MHAGDKPTANPHVVFREEFDDWAVLFNPDTGRGFGLNPTGMYVWKSLDGRRTIDEIILTVRRDLLDVPESACDDLEAFVAALVAEGLAGFQSTEPVSPAQPQGRATWLQTCFSKEEKQSEAKPCTYESPKLIHFTGARAVRGDCYNHGSQGGSCQSGAGATDCCDSGTCPSTTQYNCTCFGSCNVETNCWGGTSVRYQCLSGNVACNVCTTGGNLY